MYVSTYILADGNLRLVLLIRTLRGGVPDDLLQGRLQVRRLGRAQADEPRPASSTSRRSSAEPLGQLLEQQVLGGGVLGAGDDEASRDPPAAVL